MSSTSGVISGNLLAEISRLRDLLSRQRRRARWLEQSRDQWRQQAIDARATLAAQERNRQAWDRRRAA